MPHCLREEGRKQLEKQEMISIDLGFPFLLPNSAGVTDYSRLHSLLLILSMGTFPKKLVSVCLQCVKNHFQCRNCRNITCLSVKFAPDSNVRLLLSTKC